MQEDDSTHHALAGLKSDRCNILRFCDGMQAKLLFLRIKMIVELKMLNINILIQHYECIGRTGLAVLLSCITWMAVMCMSERERGGLRYI